MRPDRVVGLPPTLDEHLGLEQGVEHLAIQKFIPQLPVEALHVAVLTRRSWLDVERLHPDPPELLPHLCRGELAAVVAADVVRHTLAHEQVAQPLQDILAGQLPRYVDRRALPRALVHDRQNPERQAVCRPVPYEVVASDVVPVRRP